MGDRITKTGHQSKGDPFEFILSTSDIDRAGDVVVPGGVNLKDFNKNPIALFSHNHSMVIGVWENVRVEGKKLIGRLKLAESGTSKLVDEVRALVEQRILKAVSIGFSSIEATDIKSTGGLRFIKTALHEASLVAVPMNQNALRVKGMSADIQSILFTDTKSSNSRAVSASKQTPGGAISPKSTIGNNPMSIAAKIEAKKARQVAILDRLTEIKAVAEGDDDLTDDQNEELKTLTDEQAALEKSLDSLASIEKSLAVKATPAVPGRVLENKTGKADLVIRAALVNMLAHSEHKAPAEIIKARYGKDDELEAVVKTATVGADTTTSGWAAELTHEGVANFLDQLKAMSVYAPLAAMGVTIPFGNANSIKVPGRSGSNTDLAGAFVGESGVIPVKQGVFNAITMNRYKMGVISVFSKELARASTPQIEAILRQAMLDDTANALDNALLDNSGEVAGVRPKGLSNGVIGTASAGTTLDDIITDLRVLITSLSDINAGQNPVFIMNTARVIGLSTVTTATGGFMFRDEVAQGRIMGIPFIASSNVPSDEVSIVDAAHFATAFGTPEIEASDVATLTMANADGTAPSQALDGIGGLGTQEQVKPDSGISVVGGEAGVGTAGFQAQSMFQTWQTSVRNVMPVSWALLRAGVYDKITGVAW